MKRYAKIGVACLAIVALMVDSVAACWLFARRTYCRPCPPPCYAAPVVHSSCGIPAGAMPLGVEPVPLPGASPAVRIPWTQEQPGRAAPPPPPDGITRPSPSDRPETFRRPLPDAEPMLEPEPRPDFPEADPFENPFAQPPAADRGPLAPDREEEPRPMPGATDLDDPFAPSTTPPETTRPAEPAVPDDDPFAPRDTTPMDQPAPDDPFAPRDSAPPGPADTDSPFGPRSDSAEPADATRAADESPAPDDPFAPPPPDRDSLTDYPLGVPADTARSPMSEVQDAPMSETQEPAGEQPQAPDLDDPFAEPAGPRLSATPATEPPLEPAEAMRVWTDVTGEHQVRGQMKLILVAEQKVRILKETGKYTTVPFARLSQADRMFVAHHAVEPSTLLAGRK